MQFQTRSPIVPSSNVPGGAGEVTVTEPRKLGPESPYCPTADAYGPSIRLRAAEVSWSRSVASPALQVLPQKISCTGTPGATVPPWLTTVVSVSPTFAGNVKPSAFWTGISPRTGAAGAAGTMPIRRVQAFSGLGLSEAPSSMIA